MVKRGIIICPNIQPILGGIQFGSSDVDPFFLRKCLTYWDQVDYPSHNIGFFNSSPDVSFLESVGFIKRTRVIFPGEVAIDWSMFVHAQVGLLAKYHKESQNIWSIAQPSYVGFTDGNPNSELKEQLIFELCEALPVPSEDVPLNDILEFKEKRKDELKAFQGTIDDLYGEILKSGLDRVVRNRSIEKIGIAVQDLNKVMDEQSFFKRLLKQFDISLNVGDVFAAAGTYAATESTFSILGAVGFFRVTKGLIPKKLQLPDNLKSYAYLMHLEKELGPTVKAKEFAE